MQPTAQAVGKEAGNKIAPEGRKTRPGMQTARQTRAHTTPQTKMAQARKPCAIVLAPVAASSRSPGALQPGEGSPPQRRMPSVMPPPNKNGARPKALRQFSYPLLSEYQTRGGKPATSHNFIFQ